MIYAPDAVESLDADLEALDDADYAVIDAFIAIVWENEAVRGELAIGDFRHLKHPRFDVDPVESWQRAGYNVFRVKLWDAEGRLVGGRVIYGVDHSSHAPRLVLLGVMPRNDQDNADYQLASPFGQRMKVDYENCGLPCHAGRH